MIVKSATEPGDPNIPNEDWVYASEELLIVVDGATARTETGCVHGIAWYAEQLGQALAREASEVTQSLTEALAASIAHVASLHPECDLSHPATPSAALGIVRRTDDSAEILVLADVTVVVLQTDGAVRIITDDRVVDSASSERSAAYALPIGHPDREQALRKMKFAQQRERNRSNGFFVAAADPAVAREAHTDQLRADKIDSIAVLSDGATRAVDMFCSMTWAVLLEQLRRIGPNAVITTVRQEEAQDADARHWPRSKASDDASIAFLSGHRSVD